MRRNSRLKLEFFNKYEFPQITTDEKYLQGWFGKHHHRTLLPLVKNKKLILELGSWLGKSAIKWLENSNANVICVDTWEGSIEHKSKRYKALLPKLKDLFLTNLEPWRDRVFPLQMKTINGIAELYKYNIIPDFIYIDASHEYENVYMDLALCHSYFPKALISGDDWKWESVSKAVITYCDKNQIKVVNDGAVWYLDH